MASTDQNNVVILETDPARRDYLKSIISNWGFTPIIFEKESICLDNLSSLAPDLVIAGPLSFDRIFRFINTLKMRDRRLPVLIISSDNSVHDYVNTNGFADVLVIETPIDPLEIKQTMDKIQHNNLDNQRDQDGPLIIGNSPEIIKIKRIISELGPSKEPVLIQGEAGTGKDIVARAIHYASDRRDNPLIKINTAEFSRELAENERHAYSSKHMSSVDRNNKDLFALADTGSIFLDEIETMPAFLQAKLIQVFEEEPVIKTGTDEMKPVDVRIIAATHPDIGRLVETGKFRKDLYFRLNVINIEIPPLRNRTGDIPLLAAFFNDKFCGEFGKSHYELSRKTIQMFNHYHWPGNVRELKNVVKRVVSTGSENSIIDSLLLNDHQHQTIDFIDCCEDIYILSELSDVKTCLKDLNHRSLKDICKEFVTRTERKLMKKALERTNWNRKKAAMMLNISYKSLLNKIKAYNLT
jgi:DNA-binding NtrC family response regulator